MSLAEMELNQQLVEALAECDRLRTEHCKTISARYEVEMERDRLQAELAAMRLRAERVFSGQVDEAEKWRVKAGHFEMERDAMQRRAEAAESDMAESEAQCKALREALKRYGRHLRDDMDREYCTSVKCACGFDAALNPPAGEPKP